MDLVVPRFEDPGSSQTEATRRRCRSDVLVCGSVQITLPSRVGSQGPRFMELTDADHGRSGLVAEPHHRAQPQTQGM